MVTRDFIDMPARIDRLPRDKRGFPIPRFVHWMDEEPDFRIIDPGHMVACVKRDLCWICGERMGAHKAFVIGPMCCVNRISAEPPSHRDCALFAAKNCPFLSIPLAKRNERGLPENKFVAGVMIERNPGVTAVWMTRSYQPIKVGQGVLFQIGEPTSVEFYARARIATRAEVDESVRTGFPFLQSAAEQDGPEGVRELAQYRRRFDALMDSAVMTYEA